MALITCPNCGKNISDKSEKCIHCGFDFKSKIDEKTEDIHSIKEATEAHAHAPEPAQPKRKISKGIYIIAFAIVIAAIVIAVAITTSSNKTSVPKTSGTETSTDIAKDKDENPSDESNDNTDNDSEPIDIESIHLTPDNMRPVLLETDDILLKFHSFSYANGETVYGLNLLLENNTDKEISVKLEDVIIEGYEISCSQGKTLVDPGNKAICDSSVWQDNIDEAGIQDWSELSGYVTVREDYFGKELYRIPVVIQKSCWETEKTYQDTSYDEVNPVEKEVLDENAIVISKDNMTPVLLKENEITLSINNFDTANNGTVFKVNFTLDNQTSGDVSVSLTDVVVNGYEISTSQGKSLVAAGNKAVCDSSVWEKDLEQAHITNWDHLQGNVVVRKDYFGDELFSIPVVIQKEVW